MTIIWDLQGIINVLTYRFLEHVLQCKSVSPFKIKDSKVWFIISISSLCASGFGTLSKVANRVPNSPCQ